MAHKYTNISDLSVLIVGLGSIGSRHYSNLRALGLTKLGILRTSNTKPHTPLDLANIPVYDDYAKALANKGFDSKRRFLLVNYEQLTDAGLLAGDAQV